MIDTVTSLSQAGSSLPSPGLACLHCSAPLPEGLRLEPGKSDEPCENFCCNGCRIIYQTINSLGLGDYYKLNSIDINSIPKKFGVAKKSFIWLDSENFLNSNGRKISEYRVQVLLALSGIHCTGCVWLLENLPGAIEGIEMINVNLTRGEINITFNPHLVKLSRIGELLYSLGYDIHGIDEGRSTSQRLALRALQYKLGIAAFCSLNTMMLAVSFFQAIYTGMPEQYASFMRWISLAISLPAVAYCAIPFYLNSIISLRLYRAHIDQPISLAIVAGFILSCVNTINGNPNVYYDSVCALIFLLLAGRYLQQSSLEKYLYSTANSTHLLPATALKKVAGGHVEIPAGELISGDFILVESGAALPADGRIITDSALIDNSIITGEALPVKVFKGEKAHAGSVNMGQEIEMLAEETGNSTRIAALARESENLKKHKAGTAKLSERAAGYFVIFSAFSAVCCFFYRISSGFEIAFNTALSVLIVTCPCALGIATPTALALAFEKARKHGIIVKNPDAFEILSKVKNIYLDKTGTITDTSPCVKYFYQFSTINLPALIKACICCSPHHPISLALSRWLDSTGADTSSAGLKAVFHPGKGAAIEESYYAGSKAWFDSFKIDLPLEHRAILDKLAAQGLSLVLVWNQLKLYAIFGIENTISADAIDTIEKLGRLPLNLAILSGDNLNSVTKAAALTGIKQSSALGELTPEGKAEVIRNSGRISAMVGDGFNDSLALAAADIGIGIRGGLEASFYSSDVYITGGKLSSVYRLIKGSQAIFNKIRLTLLISIFYNLAGLILAACGMINPLIAALVMPASSISSLLIATSGDPFKLKKE